MRLKYAIYLASVIFLIALGSAAEENESINALPSLPKENLPEGFKLLAIKDASTQGVNMTEEIMDLLGTEGIGPVNASVGIYTWAPLGTAYDSKITLLLMENEERAKAAISNYMSLPEFKNPPYKDVSRFSSAIINGHKATEIRDAVGDMGLRYLYLWNKGNVVVLVEGNDTRSKSLELANATGL